MKVLVTGATGNVGTAVLRRLQAEGAQVVGVARRRPDDTAAPYAGARWVSADVGDPASVALLTQALRGVDAVVHLAWQIQPGHDEATLHRTNVEGTRHLLTAMQQADVPRLAVASSVGAYSAGRKDRRVKEDWPTEGIPSSSYSRHKAAVERLLDEVQEQWPGLTISRLRPGLIFQAGAASEIARYFLGPLVPIALAGRVALPVVPVPSAFVFQAVHADDVAAAFWTVLAREAGGAFNVAAEPVLTPHDVARAVGGRRAVPAPLSLVRLGAALTWRARLQPTSTGWVDLATQSPIMSTQRIRDLGWSPSRSAREALAELVRGMQVGAGGASPPLRRRRAVSDRSA